LLFFFFLIHRLFSVISSRRDMKRMLQARHIIQEAAKCPHIHFEVERLALQYLRAGVERCANLADLQALAGTYDTFGYSQVSDLHKILLIFFNSYLNRVVLH
jgi:hypothetical protein